MTISADEQPAIQTYVHDLLTPRWLRWTLLVVLAPTITLATASALLHSAPVGRAAEVGAVASMLLCGYWTVRALWLCRQLRREPREIGAKLAVVAMRRDGMDVRLRRERFALVGGPLDGDRVRVPLPKGARWPASWCLTVAGVRQHYQLERVDGGATVTYRYVGECG